jgi:hypothetical protein
LDARSILFAAVLGVPTIATSPAAEQVPAVFDLATATITYDRDQGYCPGCSKYTIALRGDGTGSFAGRRESTLLGPVSFAVPPDSILVLLNSLSQCGFFALGDRVTRPPAFAPWIDGQIHVDMLLSGCEHDFAKITVEIGSFSKAVEGGEHGPCSIGACGAQIDALVHSAQWLPGAQWPLGTK